MNDPSLHRPLHPFAHGAPRRRWVRFSATTNNRATGHDSGSTPRCSSGSTTRSSARRSDGEQQRRWAPPISRPESKLPWRSWFWAPRQLWALLLVALFSGACGARADSGSSTDTGNPPVVDQRQIEVRARAGGVVVEADAGAVSPGGATVVVTNLETEASATTTAAADGSFQVELEGGTRDRYEVEVRVGGRSSAVLLGAGGVGASDAGQTPTLQCL